MELAPPPQKGPGELWESYDVEVIVTLSFLLEFLLLILGPFRKRFASGLFNGVMWFAFLFSSVITSYGLALIRKSTNSKDDTDKYLLALWGTVLFLHLGGPDTITAFSLEDNRLWLRKYLNFFAVIYFLSSIIAQSPWEQHYGKIPALLVYVVGVSRYFGWINSLLFSNLVATEIKWPRKSWLILVDEESSGDDYHGELTNLQVLQHAYTLFTRFKGLAIGFTFKFQSCSGSRKLFLKLKPKDAFRIVERELNFFYEVLYTKAWIVQTKTVYIARLVEFVLLVVALVLFFKEDKGDLSDSTSKRLFADKVITYVLLIGSVIIDVYAMLMVLTSDWFLEFVSSRNILPKPLKRLAMILNYATSPSHRWSNTFGEYNLIERTFKMFLLRKCRRCCKCTMSFCFAWPDLKLLEMGSKMIENWRHGRNERFDEVGGMRDFIVEQLRIKSSLADTASTAREIQSAKGNWILNRDESSSNLLHWIDDLEFDECILTWHIATEICFHTDDDDDDGNGDNKEDTTINRGNERNINKERMRLSKHLSDHMLYLLVMNPQMMSTVAAQGKDKSEGTRDELRKFLQGRDLRMKRSNKSSVMKEACARLLNEYYTPSEVDESSAVLISSCNLAKDIQKLGGRKWEVLSKVWFEMLCYTASHCQATTHMEQLNRGGQLLTFVWLLMVHFGLVS